MILGTSLYDVLLSPDTTTNQVLKLFKAPLKSLIGFAKRQTKAAVRCILKFESNLSEHARKYEYDGVICGHCHTPEINNFGDAKYTNCGDWVENCSEIVEHQGGRDFRSH